ncbi:MAG: ABC transporter ATP-binding protein [Archaeoglobaceae archaeon]
MEVVSVRGVRKSYGDLEVIRDVSFSVRSGEFVCIVGESGCGKTTLLKIIAGIERADSGSVSVRGGVGFVFQDDRLLPWKTALGNVMFALKARKIHDVSIAKRMLEVVGLSGFENFYPHQLSGGMRQRVGIARALAIDPVVLLMDEPFASLDARTRERMQEELLRIVREKAVIFVTHSIEEAVFLADRVIVLSPRPSEVVGEVRVELPKPRDRNSPELLKYRAKVTELLNSRTARE